MDCNCPNVNSTKTGLCSHMNVDLDADVNADVDADMNAKTDGVALG
jgi:hypothetical protein